MQKHKQKHEKAASEAKNENTEAEAEEVEGTCTGIMVNDGVETTGKAGEGHPGFHTVNEEAGHTVLSVEHVEHDMNDDTGERTKTMHNTTNANGEQTGIVMEIEHPDEELPAQCTLSDEEAGSIVLHVCSDMNGKEKDDEEADETAAAKQTEEISKEDVEIRRLTEERRNTPKEEKQRLKEVSKCIKKCIRDKKRMKIQQDIQRILEDFKGVKNIAGFKIAKRRVLITKIENERGEIITPRKGIANVFGEFYKTTYDDKEKEETEQEFSEKWEQHRLHSCELQSTNF